jgi:hypothetical protein
MDFYEQYKYKLDEVCEVEEPERELMNCKWCGKPIIKPVGINFCSVNCWQDMYNEPDIIHDEVDVEEDQDE